MRTETRKIFIYSDPHFGHKNVIKYANRLFSNINEMNSQLIKNFNKVVGHDDVVYILGDFSFLNTVSSNTSFLWTLRQCFPIGMCITHISIGIYGTAFGTSILLYTQKINQIPSALHDLHSRNSYFPVVSPCLLML